MEQYGQVIENRGETARVSLQRHLACASCGKCAALGGSKRRQVTIEALNPLKVEAGRRVMLESDDRQVLFIAFMLYIVPLGGLVAGILLGLRAAPVIFPGRAGDLVAVAFGLILMALVFLLIRIWDRRVKDDPRYKPVITEIIDAEDPCSDENKQ